jgi:hypothetical protein
MPPDVAVKMRFSGGRACKRCAAIHTANHRARLTAKGPMRQPELHTPGGSSLGSRSAPAANLTPPRPFRMADAPGGARTNERHEPQK